MSSLAEDVFQLPRLYPTIVKERRVIIIMINDENCHSNS
ncbi:hypothetical protein PUN28_016220 [Cardiocondyla obscurior]|uniref:Uncharacterized protein n=1 Tax=Cardiocondyla obscurior TaxID=286306 RepID=A0AAW2EWR1_9HYME